MASQELRNLNGYPNKIELLYVMDKSWQHYSIRGQGRIWSVASAMRWRGSSGRFQYRTITDANVERCSDILSCKEPLQVIVYTDEYVAKFLKPWRFINA